MPRKIVDSSSKKTTLREIVPHDQSKNRSTSEQSCPSCGGAMTNGPVPCPDNKAGCKVVHYGLKCSKCGKYWH